MPGMEFRPGEYTIQYLFDQRQIGQPNRLRTAQTIAYALRQLGTLRGAAPQPTDFEVINNPVSADVGSGVVRIQFARPVSYEEFGALVIETVRSNGFPDAVPHVGASPSDLWSGSLVGSLVSWVTDEPVDIGFPDVVGGVTPGINDAVRPLLGTNPVDSALTAGSTRQSEDPARDGSVAVSQAAQAARDAVQTGAAALQIPTWVYVAGGIAGGILVIALGFAVYDRVSGK